MTWDDIKNEALKDAQVKREYDALQPEYEVVKAVLNARKMSNLTQQQLADGMDMTLKVEFIPKSEHSQQ